MNAVTNAITDLKFRIPSEILNIAFKDYSKTVNAVTTLEDRILTSLVRPKVLKDCNLVGGITTKVDLNKCTIKQTAFSEYLIQVPKLLTDNKSIVSAQSIVANYVNITTNLSGMTPNPMESTLHKVSDNYSAAGVIQTSRLEVVGENLLLVQDPTMLFVNAILNCTIENNANMENINPKSYLAFSQLVTLAVKSFIYNYCEVKINEAYVLGGLEISKISDIIERYSDAEELYNEHLTKVWSKVAFMNQPNNMNKLIKAMIGNNL